MRPPFLPRRSAKQEQFSSSAPRRRRAVGGVVLSLRGQGGPPTETPSTALPSAVVQALESTAVAPVKASVLIGGSFDDDDVRVWYDAKTTQLNKERQKAALLSQRSSSLPHLSEVSRDDEDDEDDDVDVDGETASLNGSAGDDEGELKRPTLLENAGDREAGTTAGGKRMPPDDVLRGMVAALSEAEMEVAACSSYAYAKMARSVATSDGGPDPDRAQHLLESRHGAAMNMAARHWLAEKGDADLALRKMRSTLRERPRADQIRQCFEDDDDESRAIRERVRHYLGPQCRMFVRGYDPDGRAIFHFVATNSPRNADPAEGCNESNCYVLEKAIACTERRTNGRLSSIILSADLSNFQKWQAPPLSCTREMLDVLQNHYPERMHKIYVVNAPVLFWGLWNIVRPFVDPNTKAKVQFVSSMEHAIGKDQAMPYQRADAELTHPVDADEFFRLPMDRAYDE